MNISRRSNIFFVIIFLSNASLFCRKVILEFKGAYFLPTSALFRKAYAQSSALYGPELTVQLGKKHHWTKNIYGFMGIDYFQKKGVALGLCDSTTLHLVPLTLGLKYMIPLAHRVDLYGGLGFESLFFQTSNHRACVTAKHRSWTFGGITTLGTYIDLSHHVMLNLFFDYSFIKAKTKNFYGPNRTSHETDLSGSLFGVGLGYSF
jgi:outer membrane protein W